MHLRKQHQVIAIWFSWQLKTHHDATEGDCEATEMACAFEVMGCKALKVISRFLDPNLVPQETQATGWNLPKSAEISHRHNEMNTQYFRSVYFNLVLIILSKFGSLFYTTIYHI